MTQKKRRGWGFDVGGMDRSVSPHNDFYHYANGGWIRKNSIPRTESRWGSFTILRYRTEHQLRGILADVLSQKRRKKGSPEQMIADLYQSATDLKERRRRGLQPLQQYLEKVRAVHDMETLQRVIEELHMIGVGVFFGLSLDQDAKNSERYLLYLGQDGLGMPDSDYYIQDDAESKRVRKAYSAYVEALHLCMGYSTAQSASRARKIIALETALARFWMNKVDRRVIEKIYNKKTVTQLQALTPSISWRTYFTSQGVPTLRELVVMQPAYMRGLHKVLMTSPLEDIKAYLEFHLVNDFAPALTPAYTRTAFSFYGTVLTGVTHMKPLWRRALASVNSVLGEQLGKLYVAKHFDAASKKKMNVLVDDLFEAYRERIKNLDWMTPVTKRKALHKLSMMSRKIGYPKKWKSYAGLVIDPTDYVGNLIRATRYEHKRALKKLYKKVDRDEWFMYPQTVNAYNAPSLNDIAFPAAILQPPFFDVHADDAVNYGSIGSVIGHEITHGFDDEGAKYDGTGNLKKWWTKKDEALFKKKGAVLKKQFNAYNLHGVSVNGDLTLGENIADLGGASIAFDAYQRRLKKTGRKTIGGFTPEQRFFLAFAVFEREIARPEFLKLAMLTDPHSPSIFRINGPASNLPEFYDAFGVTPKSKLYRKPSERAKIW